MYHAVVKTVKTVKTILCDHAIQNKMAVGGPMIQEWHCIRNPIDCYLCCGQALLYVWKINQSSVNKYDHVLKKP